MLFRDRELFPGFTGKQFTQEGYFWAVALLGSGLGVMIFLKRRLDSRFKKIMTSEDYPFLNFS